MCSGRNATAILKLHERYPFWLKSAMAVATSLSRVVAGGTSWLDRSINNFTLASGQVGGRLKADDAGPIRGGSSRGSGGLNLPNGPAGQSRRNKEPWNSWGSEACILHPPGKAREAASDGAARSCTSIEPPGRRLTSGPSPGA